MSTNLDIITDAYRKANIINDRQVPTATQGAQGLTLLNDMMSDWEEDGIELGYFPQTLLADTIPTETKHDRGIKYNLARGIAGDNGTPVPAETLRIAELTFARLEKSTTEVIETDFSHIPLGRRAIFDVTTG